VADAILVLGAPRTGTSLVAGMLAAAGAVVPGAQVRNWDNARGHFEAAAAVRLSDRVLSLSGGSWMQAPPGLHWDGEAEHERDRLLAPHAGRPALLKDPRMLLCWPFWSGGPAVRALVGTVRHPLAAARSMSAWRRLPIDDGLRLWLAHARTLAALARTEAVPLVDIDAEPDALRVRMREIVASIAAPLDPSAMDAHFDPGELHHDGSGADGADAALLAEACALHRDLLARCPPAARRSADPFPWPALDGLRDLLAAGDAAGALAIARAALPTAPALLNPAAAEFLRAREPAVLLALLDTAAAPPALAALLRGKALLAAGRAADAAAALEPAAGAADAWWETRSLLAQAWWQSRRRAEARRLMEALAEDAVHPAGPLSTAAEWAWSAHDLSAAASLFARAIAASPAHRRGRLRCRLAELHAAQGRPESASAELRAALAEDPGWRRARDLLLEAGADPATLPPAPPE
jgi:Flp pilus assembly protein TadD